MLIIGAVVCNPEGVDYCSLDAEHPFCRKNCGSKCCMVPPKLMNRDEKVMNITQGHIDIAVNAFNLMRSELVKGTLTFRFYYKSKTLNPAYQMNMVVSIIQNER